jgi:hypothetical protein
VEEIEIKALSGKALTAKAFRINDLHIVFNFLRWLEQVCRIPEIWNSQRTTCAPYFHCCGKEVKIILLPGN